MSTRTRRVMYAAILTAAAIGLAACSSGPSTPVTSASDGAAFDLEALTAAAKAEGSLTIYGDASEASLRGWADKFTEEYGIQVFIVRNTPGPLFQQFAQEASAGQQQADVISIVDHVALDQGIDNGWIAEYTPQNADQYPESESRAGYYYPVQNGNAQTIAYNADSLSEDEIALIHEKGLDALTDPVFAGRVGVVNPQISSGVQAFWYLYTDGEAKDFGWKGMEGLAKNVGMISDTLTLGQNVIQGEIDVAVPMVDSFVSSQIANNGAPLEYVYATPTIGQTDGVAVVQNAPHPNAARLFLEWAALPETNAFYSTISQSAPTNLEATDSREIVNEPWYAPAGDDTWYDFGSDDAFLAAMKADGPYFPKWNETFGYSG